MLEETHELLEAIDSGDSDAIRDELGDLLLQVVFHAEMASEDGRWDVDDVARRLIEKLIHRHPHVFGDVEVSGADEVLTNWEKLKAEEGSGRGRGVEDEIPATLPALARAAKVQRRAAGWGVEWPSSEAAVAALREEVGALSPTRRMTPSGRSARSCSPPSRPHGSSASTPRAPSGGPPAASPNGTSACLALAAGAWSRPGVGHRGRGPRAVPRSPRPLDVRSGPREHRELPDAAVRGVCLAEPGRGDRPIDRVEVVDERAETLELPIPESEPRVPDRRPRSD